MKALRLTDLAYNEICDFISSIETVVSDCDGVLWRGSKLIPGSNVVLNNFMKLGKKILFVTNNSMKTRDEVLRKFRHLGFEVEKEDILSSSYLAAQYLSDMNFNKKVYVFGTPALAKEIQDMGISTTKAGPDALTCDVRTLLKSEIELEADVGAVVVGFDEHLSYPKIVKAASYLKDPDCLFLATNMDGQEPPEKEIIIPGAGPVVAAVMCSSGRQPYIMGKPSHVVHDTIVNLYDIDPQSTLMIGDRGDTDILFGKRSGYKTLLTLSGVTSLRDVKRWQKSGEDELNYQVPDYYVNSLMDLVPYFDI